MEVDGDGLSSIVEAFVKKNTEHQEVDRNLALRNFLLHNQVEDYTVGYGVPMDGRFLAVSRFLEYRETIANDRDI